MPWVPKTSRSTGKTYFFHTETKKTTWKRPPGVVVSGKKKTKKESAKPAIVRRLDDDDAANPIADGYGKVAQNTGARTSTKGVRAWNNRVKRLLLERYRPCGVACKVLDLACGRGGDMGKILRDPGVRRYRGVDVSDGAVQEAIRRTKVHNRHGALVDFLVGDARAIDWCGRCEVTDAGSPYKEWTGVDTAWRLNEVFDDDGHRFDLINMQYALHYMCQSRASTLAFLKKVHAALAVNGVWVGTVPCADRVRDAVDGRLALPKACRITPSKSWTKGARLGEAYTFFLEGCVPGLEEHLVPKNDLVALAKEAGLETVLVQNAADFVSTDNPLVGLYNVFAFRKKK
jgi:hypothetical protein